MMHTVRLVVLVERMLMLHKQHLSTPGEKTMLEREIASTDKAIDRLVYELSAAGMIPPLGLIFPTQIKQTPPS